MKAIWQKKALITYFSLAYFISWIIWFPLYSPVFGIKNLPVLPFHHGIGGLGPMLAAFITTGIFEKKEGVRLLAKQILKIRPLVCIAIAFLSPFILAAAAVAISSASNHVSFNLDGIFAAKEFPELTFAGFFLYNLCFFGIGEETGWRGFALPRLQAKYNALWAGIILTVFWAIWHWPLFLYRPGYTSMGIAGISGWIFSLLTGSILLSWIYNSSRASILACAIFHATIDIAFLADFSDGTIANYMGMLITIWGIVTIIIYKPKNLSHSERISK
ncbi:CPBP family intramembrane metalloprotease [Flavobacterium album]|uniref:CPBP family intramembrane metalloprotease n=1 Tax=Flavobacterium album TaxID=2175091 RepID=A0A2S1QU86_9FLAO|nr:type II CAAX endopeptidase family protein [Flavobacterium album]AWH83978.1 CPBP family intramembrane metalloprotease [Flavobacterium album]